MDIKYNINVDLFKRFSPEKKLDIINTFTTLDFLSITQDTVLRMIKEAGTGDNPHKTRSHTKTLRFTRSGNHWNSSINSAFNDTKGNVFFSVYIQGDDTDTEGSCSLKHFLTNCEEVNCGELGETFRNGYRHVITARYNRENRAEVIKQLCIAYVKEKYNV